jgi:hypothetical protein
MSTTTARAAVGEILPGYSRIVRPVVRVEAWGPIGVGLEPIDQADASAAGWSTTPEYRLTTPNTRARMAVVAHVTGRTPTPWGGDYWTRGRLEVCGDGEPSHSLPCWFLVEWTGN